MRNNKLTKWIGDNSATILTVLGAVGVVATGVAAAKETPKALKLLEQAKEEKGEELTKLEVVVNAGQAYIPAIGIGASTIMCIFGANCLNKKQQASLVSAYEMLANYHREYRKTLIDMAPEDLKDKSGRDIDNHIQVEMAHKYSEFHKIGLDVPDQKCIFIEENSQQRIYAYEREIMDAEMHINRNYTLSGFADVNDVLNMIGLIPQPEFDDVGWDIADEYYWIDFEHVYLGEENGMPIYLITTTMPPTDFK